MNKEYVTLREETVTEKIIERSRFICSAKFVTSQDEAKEYISKITKEHPFATHNCYAYITEECGVERLKCSDDGEPQGTAGMPMLEALKNSGLYNVVAVVTRYFGGIKLGAGGLIRAYSSSVSECISAAKLMRAVCAVTLSAVLEYDEYNIFSRISSNFGAEQIDCNYNDKIFMNIAVERKSIEKFLEKVKETFGGKPILKITGEKYIFI